MILRINKIQYKFAILFLVLLSLATGIIGWFSFDKTEKAVISNALSSMHDDLEHVYQQNVSFHDRARSTMSFALENKVFRDYFELPETRSGNRLDDKATLILSPQQANLREQITRWSRALQKRFPIVETCLIDRSGREHVRLTWGEEARLEDLSATEDSAPFFEPTFQLALGEVHVSYPYMSADAAEWVFAYTSPVVLEGGDIPAFYHFEIPLAMFRDFLDLSTFEDDRDSKGDNALSDRLLILSKDGLVVMDSNQQIDFSRKPEAEPESEFHLRDYLPHVTQISPAPEFIHLMDQAMNGEEESGYFDLHGERHFVSFKPLPLFGWSLVQLKSYDSLLKGNTTLANIRTVIIGVALCILILGFLAVWIVSGWITRPLARLSLAMKNLEEGQQDIELISNSTDELGHIIRVFTHMRREIHRNQVFLCQERNKLTTIILSTREGVVVSDSNDKVVLVNPAAERLLNKTMEQICKDGFFQLVNDPEYVQRLLENKTSDVPEVIVFNDLVLNFYASTLLGPDGIKIGSAALIRDITKEKNLEEELRTLSFTDKLTGLFNRRWLEEFLPKEFSRVVRYHMEMSILFFDVDHFKKFNDNHGHDMGDLVLETIGKTLRSTFRRSDYSCRFGGEEFCVILTNIGPIDAANVAEIFRKKIEALDIKGLKVTISIGVASHPQAQAKNTTELMKLADNALYAGKNLGRNRVVRWDQLEG